MPKNISLPDDFGDRLRHLRESRFLTKQVLADLAGISYQAVNYLEKQARERANQQTLMNLAEALELSYEELLHGPKPEGASEPLSGQPPHPRTPQPRTSPRVVPGRRISYTTFGLTGAVLLVAIAFLFTYARSHAEVSVEGTSVVARDALFGTELWSAECYAFSPCVVAPWDAEVVLTGVAWPSGDDTPLLARDRATGRILWSFSPDRDQMARACGKDMVGTAPTSCKGIAFGDIDGDGEVEIVARFTHSRYHPSPVCLISRDGTLLRQYTNKGHLLAMFVADIDGDGKDEVVAGGANNTPQYDGPTALVLDDRHWRGASVDSLCNPWSTEPDSCLVRLVMPGLPAAYEALTGDSRYTTKDLRFFSTDDGNGLILLSVYSRSFAGTDMRLELDADLRPRRADFSDQFAAVLRRAGADSLLGSGPADPAWRTEWLSRASRFGAGLTEELTMNRNQFSDRAAAVSLRNR